MTDLTQRAHDLALTLYSTSCDDAASERKTLILTAMSDIRREALEEAYRRFASWPHTGNAIMAAIQTLIDVPTSEAPDPPDNGSGFLEVGTVDGQIVINLPKPMAGHINLMPEQAYILGRVLLEKADARDPRDTEIERLPPCNDAVVMRLWRECELPEYFLGNGGTNHKLVAFMDRIKLDGAAGRDHQPIVPLC